MPIMKKTFRESENTYGVAIKVLELLNIEYLQDDIQSFLHSHPNFPSLLSLSDLFTSKNIENIVLLVASTTIPELPTPFVAHVKDHQVLKSKFLVVTEITTNNLKYYDPSKGLVVESFAVFNSKFGGTCLFLGNSENAERLSVKDKKRYLDASRRRWISYGCLFLLVIANFLNISSTKLSNEIASWLVLISFKAIELITSIALVNKDFDRGTDSVLNTLCTLGTPGSSFNCNTVLESRVSGFLGFLKMSEFGLVYFLGSFLYVLVASYFCSLSDLLSLLSLFTWVVLPITLYLFYYQIYIVKRICLLCFSIQILSWLEFIQFNFVVTFDFNIPSLPHLSLAVSAFATSCFLCLAFIPKMSVAGDSMRLKKKANFFLYKANVMNRVLESSKINTSESFNSDILLGNETGSVRMLAILNLYCPHCKDEFFDLLELSQRHKAVSINIRFISDDSLIHQETLRHVLSWIIQNESPEEILTEWFSKHFDLRLLRKTFPIVYNHSYEASRQTILNLHHWAKSIGLKETPQIFINETLMPPELNVSDFNFYLYEFVKNEKQLTE